MITSNFTRHLRTKHKVTSKNKLVALSIKTSHSGRSGLRPVKFDDIPDFITDHWKEKTVRKKFEKFLSKYNLYIAKA